MKECKQLVDPTQPLSVRRQCELLGVARSTVYYKGTGEPEQNLRLMASMDRLFTEDPTLGVLGMQDELRELGMHYNIKRIRRLLRKMGVEAIYTKRNLSKLSHATYAHPLPSASFEDYKTQSRSSCVDLDVAKTKQEDLFILPAATHYYKVSIF